ncbi:MAG: radical SAM protein [Pseudomonadales bacterium]
MELIARESSGGRFVDPYVTADGAERASVALTGLRTLWFNTGTLCNLTCANCYIESSPNNDRLAYLSRADVRGYLEEIEALGLPVTEIGITGGEPFMNPEILDILRDCLEAGLQVLVLTNAMRPMLKCAGGLLALQREFGARLTLRVSVDHPDRARHEEERGGRSWTPMVKGLKWLSDNGFRVHVAGRTRWGEDEPALRAGFARLFASLGVAVDASDPAALVLFPEMDERVEVPEITTACWGILDVNPADMMCASARMVVRRRGSLEPDVVACTLLPYAPGFSYGPRLADSLGPVALNHPHCAKFCVLGGGSCSA